jgi:protocatechuate 3,4-dioxygenase beta subunit
MSTMTRSGRVALVAAAVVALVAAIWSCGGHDAPPRRHVAEDSGASSSAYATVDVTRSAGTRAGNGVAGAVPGDPSDAVNSQDLHTLSGRVRDADGRALAGAAIRAEPVAPFASLPDKRKPVDAVANGGGAFALRGLASGEWRLLCSADGAVRTRVGVLRVPQVTSFDVVLPVGPVIAGTLVDDATGAPIAGATVRGLGIDYLHWNDRDDAWLVECTTDGSGAFKADVHRDGFRIGKFRIVAPGFSAVPGGFGEYGEIGSDGSDRVEVALRARRGATLTGVVTGPSGPVAGAHVAVRHKTSLDGEFDDFVVETTTDAAGHYEARGVAPGKRPVRIEAPGLVQREAHRIEFTVAGAFESEPPDACVVDFDEDGVVVHDVTLEPVGPWPTCTAAGRVIADDDAPIAGATVESVYAPRVETKTAADGTFSLEGVPTDGFGLTEIAASHPEFDRDTHTVVAKPGETHDDLKIRLARRARLRGRVTTADGAAAAGARVVVSVADKSGKWTSFETPVGADGAYSALLDAASFVGVDCELADMRGRGESNGSDEKSEFVVDVVLAPVLSIVGRAVVAGTSDPVAGVPVAVVFDFGGLDIEGSPPPPIVQTSTAADGTFRIDGLRPGTLNLRVGDERFTGGRATINVPRVEPVVVGLEPARDLGGRVAFADGSSASGVKVTIRFDDDSKEFGDARTTGRDGAFLYRGLAPGAYALELSGGDPRICGTRVRAVQSGTRALALVVSPELALEVQVVDPEGRPVERAEVWSHPSGGRDGPSAGEANNVDIPVRLGGLDAGPHDVTVNVDGFLTGVAKNVRAGGGAVVVKLDRGLSIDGVLLDVDGTPLGFATMTAEPVGSGGDESACFQRATTAENGRFHVTGLAPGRWKFASLQRGGNRVPSGAAAARPKRTRIGDDVFDAGATDVRVRCVEEKTKDE